MENMGLLQKNCSRRTYLSSISFPLLGGCTSENDPPPGLDEVVLYNGRDVESVVTVSLRKDDEHVFKASYTLQAHSSRSGKSETIRKPWMGEKAYYEILVDAPGVGENSYSTAEFLKMAADTEGFNCYEVTVRIDENLIDFLPNIERNCRN